MIRISYNSLSRRDSIYINSKSDSYDSTSFYNLVLVFDSWRTTIYYLFTLTHFTSPIILRKEILLWVECSTSAG